MKNFLMILALLTIVAGFSLAEDKSTNDETNAMTNTVANEALTNQTVTDPTDKPAETVKKPRSKWDFSDHPEDKKKEEPKKKSSLKDKYSQPYSGPGKIWKAKKSQTTNNTTTSRIVN